MGDSFELDLQLAIQLQEQFEEELRHQSANVPKTECEQALKNSHGKSEAPLTVSLVDPAWELVDPVPDVHALFCTYNDQFFWGKLISVSVSWSPRMTLCAGLCSYEGRGGLCSIRLSVPLLKLRPRSDLVETLLHEMIHAYLFVTANNRDRDGHGPEFLKHMHRINDRARTKISVYHSFHDEVAVYQQHVWQCGGPCRQRRPYYGLVKRSMNRAPGPSDRWWSEHRRTCGGTYTKIKEPEAYAAKSVKRKAALPHNGTKAKRKASTAPTEDIRNFFTGSSKSLNGTADNVSAPTSGGSNTITNAARTATDRQGFSSTNSNIRGFGSTSSGAVRAVEVGNASRSNIVGFNKGLNKGTSNSENRNEGSSNSFRKKGGMGGCLAFGSGGTLVLNPKTSSKAATIETGSEAPTNTSEQQGYVLSSSSAEESRVQAALDSAGRNGGRPQKPVSRLLAEYDANVALRNTRPQTAPLDVRPNGNRPGALYLKEGNSPSLSPSLSTDASSSTQPKVSQRPTCSINDSLLPKRTAAQNSLTDSDESDDEDTDGVKICPLCERSICINKFLSHISVCMGDWNEDLGLEMSDLPLLSALQDLDASNNACVPVSSCNRLEDTKVVEDGTAPRGAAGPSVAPRRCPSHFLGASQKHKSDSKLSAGVSSRNENREKICTKEMQSDEFVSVSDSDEEFDEKYWKKPVLSVVQLTQDINKLGVNEGNGSGACAPQFQIAASACERGNVGTKRDDDADAAPSFPCPVCGELYTEDYITSVHINTHFD